MGTWLGKLITMVVDLTTIRDIKIQSNLKNNIKKYISGIIVNSKKLIARSLFITPPLVEAEGY